MRERYKESEKKLVVKLLELSEQTSNIQLGFGYTSESGQCENGIVIYQCAGKILSYLASREDISLYLNGGKVYVTVFD